MGLFSLVSLSVYLLYSHESLYVEYFESFWKFQLFLVFWIFWVMSFTRLSFILGSFEYQSLKFEFFEPFELLQSDWLDSLGSWILWNCMYYGSFISVKSFESFDYFGYLKFSDWFPYFYAFNHVRLLGFLNVFDLFRLLNLLSLLCFSSLFVF